MSSNPRKIIAVAGATGAQGGGLVRAILRDPSGQFAARALTRDTNSEKARQLTKLGAEVVNADVDDLDSLKKAFDGAAAAYCVTFFWEHLSAEREFTHASNLARATSSAGVQHVIWSTLEDTRRFVPLEDDRMPTLQGRYKVPHFDAKGDADQVFRELGMPTTFLLTSFYWENFIYFGLEPKKGPDGVLAITMPMGDQPLPGIASEDIGKCALEIFRRGAEFRNRTVGIAGEHLTGAEMAAGMSKAVGKEVRYNDVPPEVFRGFGFPGADDVGNMFQFNRDFSKEFCAVRDPEFTRTLNPELQTFEAWLKQNATRIPIS
jgi:uncharacterized protein YbjT (DUF2867 family)